MEALPFEIIETLRAANLINFVNADETTPSKIQLEIYENQKYRPLIGEWGGIEGIHLLSGVDRKSFTTESGDAFIRYC